MSERQPPVAPDDTIDDDDDTVQGVSRRAVRDLAEAQRIQDEQNAAAGLTPTEPPATPPADTMPPADKAPRKPSGA